MTINKKYCNLKFTNEYTVKAGNQRFDMGWVSDTVVRSQSNFTGNESIVFIKFSSLWCLVPIIVFLKSKRSVFKKRYVVFLFQLKFIMFLFFSHQGNKQFFVEF